MNNCACRRQILLTRVPYAYPTFSRANTPHPSATLTPSPKGKA
ncbi:MAG: hypothetical protein ACI4RP_08510 [Acutalibacteraceae bacterium]